MLIEASLPLTVRLPSGPIHLKPGQPVDLPDEQAKRLLEKAPNKVRMVQDASPLVRPGVTIEWQGADLTMRQGLVDFLHVNAYGTTWAFYSLPDGIWGVVNTKYVALVNDRKTHHAQL